jgi:cephalosporin-C deacetylase-like acetyl esterase
LPALSTFDLFRVAEYQGWDMRIVNVAAATVLFALPLALAQNPVAQNPARDGGTVTNGAPAQNGVRGVETDPTINARDARVDHGAPAAAMGRPVAGSPAQAGREALWKYLDDIADKDTAVRRETMAGITTRAQAELRQQEVRTRLLELMGGGFQRTPLNAKVVGSTQMDGFRIEKVLYESQPGFYVTALFYVPDGVTNGPQGLKPGSSNDANGTSKAVPLSTAGGGAPGGVKYPAIVMAPGHASSGKAGDFAMAALFARNGFAVLSYDPIGQGERLEYLDPNNLTKMSAGDPYPGATLASRATGEHGEAGLQPTLIGDAVGRYFAWDGVRAVDYLISRPEVDAGKIGAFGCSGGGAMTALLSAADKRVKATATACYFTSFDTLLPSIGAQDAEQSTPGFIASGFDFPDLLELAAPRAYAMVGTVSDMFPWAGFLKTAQEARRFYSLFDASAEGVGSSQLSGASSQLPTPTGPTLNPDTSNEIPASSPFQVIAGIGGHGNLKPIQAQIVGFFLVHLAGGSADEYKADASAAQTQGQAVTPGSTPSNLGHPAPAGALQVTETGQVATSFPGSETVFSLNLKRAKEKLPQLPVQTLLQVQTDVREVTEAEAVPGKAVPAGGVRDNPFSSRWRIQTDPGVSIDGYLEAPDISGRRYPATLVVTDSVANHSVANSDEEARERMNGLGTVYLAITPRPSPPGGEETKSPILGPFYMTELRAELVGKTILGMRVDDVIRAVDYLANRPDVNAANITVVASGHMGLVALHAAVLDKRIKHVTVDRVLESYDSLLHAPMPLDAPQDILPGVLLKYDIPDLVRVLGDRVTATDWLPGTANLGVK